MNSPKLVNTDVIVPKLFMNIVKIFPIRLLIVKSFLFLHIKLFEIRIRLEFNSLSGEISKR